MKFEIFKFETVTSTNDIAANLIKDKKKVYGYVHANNQTKGRGTKGKKWVSKVGNLFGSIFFPLKNEYPPFNEFALISPVLISNIIKRFCVDKNITFKWPNDVLVEGRKICGILQEVISTNSNKFLIIGIGINIVSSPKIDIDYNATNIFFETKKIPKSKEIINLIIKSYEKFFRELNTYSFLYYKKKVELISNNKIKK